MCTVTIFRNSGETIITSNRDEQVARAAALQPKKYLINGKNITFPKDPKGGGTWFAADESGNVIVLLNGARQSHQVKPGYRKSRGLIVLDLISSTSAIDCWNEIDLNEIEPFTIVLHQDEILYDLRWNGEVKEKNIVECKYAIWSSATLYAEHIRHARENWFEEFLKENDYNVNAGQLCQFHTTSHGADIQNGLVIDRDQLKTLSITQALIVGKSVELNYSDLQQVSEPCELSI